MSQNDLESKILNIIKDDQYNTDDLLQILSPLPFFINNDTFNKHVNDIIEILIKDRDGNKKFTSNDIILLSHDISSIISLLTCLILLIGSLSNVKLQYNSDEMNDLIFKLLVYIFYMEIPKIINTKWSYDEKKIIMDVLIKIYGIVKSSQIIKHVIEKIFQWLKTNSVFTCRNDKNKKNILERKMPNLKIKLYMSVNNVNNKSEIISLN